MCYGTKLHTIEPTLKDYILDGTGTPGVDRRTGHGAQRTRGWDLRKVLLIPYSAAIRRMAQCKIANIIDKHALEKIDKWPFTHDGESDPISPETFYNEDAWDTIKTGDEFKKLGMTRLLGQVPECLDLTRLHELALQRSPHEEMLRQEYITYVQDEHGPLFPLHPQLFQTLANQINYGNILTQTAIRPLMKLLCSRPRHAHMVRAA
ncbi:SNF2-rel-dom domain-containing protein [Fusarium sp. LHS14.1]|nr:SNF2-rel-dom domain-containing protein [Fusarium sp. LHS14.1]